mgnify:CR=1 FL=1
MYRAAVLTVSDRVSRGERPDEGGPLVAELLKNAELDSPFEESCLRGVCEEAKAWLDSYDLTGIA